MNLPAPDRRPMPIGTGAGPMAQRKSPSDGQTRAPALAPPPWLQRATPYTPGRRARMLDDTARARALPQRQAATAASRPGSMDILGDAFGYAVLFGAVALLFQ